MLLFKQTLSDDKLTGRRTEAQTSAAGKHEGGGRCCVRCRQNSHHGVLAGSSGTLLTFQHWPQKRWRESPPGQRRLAAAIKLGLQGIVALRHYRIAIMGLIAGCFLHSKLMRFVNFPIVYFIPASLTQTSPPFVLHVWDVDYFSRRRVKAEFTQHSTGHR